MNKMNRALSLLLALAMMIGFLPAAAPAAEASAAPSASTSTGTANGVTLTQKAEWDGDVPGETAVRVTLDVTSQMDLQSASDVVFLIDRSISQPLDDWKRDAKNLAGQLNVPGMRFALVTYHSSAETALDFTGDVTALNSAIDGIQPGYNCNCYAGLKEVKSLLESRDDRTRPAYVVLFTNGRFNMNLAKMRTLARQLDAAAPIYYTNSSISLGAGSILRDLQKIAATVGQSRTFSDVTLRVKLADGFELSHGYLSIAGSGVSPSYDAANGTFRLSAYQKGQSMQAVLFGKLKDKSMTGSITAALEASISSGAGLSVTTGAVSVTRSGYSVTYNGNDSATEAPKDSALYASGSTVTVKPSSLRKAGWNFSGWVTDTGANIQDGKFVINADTTLNAAWGRAYVKLSSSTVSSNVEGTQMLDADAIKRLPNGAFYNIEYWRYLASIILEDKTEIPSDCVARWDITDTNVEGNTPRAVMAWITKTEATYNPYGAKYDLHIGGQGGLTAPVDCSGLFLGCSAVTITGLDKLDTSKVTDMTEMFSQTSRLETLDISSWDTSNVESMGYMFYSCGNLKSLNVSGLQIPKVGSMGKMFQFCQALETLDISTWDISNVWNMSEMFQGCSKLTKLTLGDNWDKLKVGYMDGMFNGCSSLTSLDVSNWNTSAARTMEKMFLDCSSLTRLDVANWNTSNVENMGSMFSNCCKLKQLDLSGWNTEKVTIMSGMFNTYQGTSELTEVKFGDNWNTSNVTDTNCMFNGCSSLTRLDVAEWDMSQVTIMDDMFGGCHSLTSLDISKWSPNRAQSMSGMFCSCSSLTTLDVTNWSTSNVVNMSRMFASCTNLTTLDLSKWVMTGVKYVDSMFSGDTQLASIGTRGLIVATGCTWSNWNTNAHSALTTITIRTTNGEQLYPETNTASLSGYQPEALELPEETGEEFPPEELPTEIVEEAPQEPEVLTSASMQSAPPSYEKDSNGRPLYARDKAGLWNCGTVQAGDVINYSLELQYLNEDGSANGVSGVLTVANPIPEGLTPSGIAISGPQWIKDNPSAIPSGDVVTGPEVTGNVLTFTAKGLSAGAKFVVTYSCTVPEAGASGRAFLNTASVDDGGLSDYADPVLHTMDGVTMYDVTFAYTGDAPAGAAVPPAQQHPAGTAITLPSPAVPGYTFNGWTQGGAPYAGGSAYTVSGNASFIGSWTGITIPTVRVNYIFTGDLPDNADPIQSALLEGVPEEYPANATATVPALGVVPAGYRFQWLAPVGVDGQFNVGSGPEITITGQWTKERYPVTYRYDGSAPSGAPALPAPSDHTWGTPVSLAPEPDHTETHLFLGWTGVDIDADGKFQMPMVPVTVTGTWAARPAPAAQEVLIDPNGGVWNGSDEEQVLLLDDYSAQVAAGTFPDARKEGTVFVRWEITDESGAFAKRVTAQWQENEPQDPGAAVGPPVTPPVPVNQTVRYFVITAEAGEGGSILPEGKISVPQGASRTFTAAPAAGYVILDVEVDGESVGAVASYTFRDVRQDHKIEARFAPVPEEGGGVKWLNTADHTAYLQGFPDGTFQPDGSMTRGEAAQMFYNLLLERTPAAPAGFSDVPAGMWYEDAVNALSALGVMHGDGRGRFLPEQTITRAEFAAAAVRFAGEAAEGRTRFADVGEKDWFFAPVMSAAALGWITGYDGGVFCPDIPISRSEAAAIVNRMLGRSADRAYADSRAGELRRFPDVTANHWAYYDILEASNGHDYYLDQDGAEIWSRLDGSR